MVKFGSLIISLQSKLASIGKILSNWKQGPEYLNKISNLIYAYIEFKHRGRHSSVVSSAPTIVRPRVRIPSTPSMLFQFVLKL